MRETKQRRSSIKCLWLEPRITLSSDCFFFRQVDDDIIAARSLASDVRVGCINYYRPTVAVMYNVLRRWSGQGGTAGISNRNCIWRTRFCCLNSNLENIESGTMGPHTSQSYSIHSFTSNQLARRCPTLNIDYSRWLDAFPMPNNWTWTTRRLSPRDNLVRVRNGNNCTKSKCQMTIIMKKMFYSSLPLPTDATDWPQMELCNWMAAHKRRIRTKNKMKKSIFFLLNKLTRKQPQPSLSVQRPGHFTCHISHQTIHRVSVFCSGKRFFRRTNTKTNHNRTQKSLISFWLSNNELLAHTGDRTRTNQINREKMKINKSFVTYSLRPFHAVRRWKVNEVRPNNAEKCFHLHGSLAGHCLNVTCFDWIQS